MLTSLYLTWPFYDIWHCTHFFLKWCHSPDSLTYCSFFTFHCWLFFLHLSFKCHCPQYIWSLAYSSLIFCFWRNLHLELVFCHHLYDNKFQISLFPRLFSWIPNWCICLLLNIYTWISFHFSMSKVRLSCQTCSSFYLQSQWMTVYVPLWVT